MLSVVAQQLLTIRHALLARSSHTTFAERRIAVVPGCGVFITMNPGYAGRTELPDNLKALVSSAPCTARHMHGHTHMHTRRLSAPN